MSIRSSVRSLVIIGLSLGTTGIAFARNPPALVQSQGASGPTVESSGYRGSLARVSESGRASRSAGYRDSLSRFAQRSAPVRVASR
jgi:hypothetical protein